MWGKWSADGIPHADIAYKLISGVFGPRTEYPMRTWLIMLIMWGKLSADGIPHADHYKLISGVKCADRPYKLISL